MFPFTSISQYDLSGSTIYQCTICSYMSQAINENKKTEQQLIALSYITQAYVSDVF